MMPVMSQTSQPFRYVVAYPLWVKICHPAKMLLLLWGLWGLALTSRFSYAAMVLLSLGVSKVCLYYRSAFRQLCREAAYRAGYDPTIIDFV